MVFDLQIATWVHGAWVPVPPCSQVIKPMESNPCGWKGNTLGASMTAKNLLSGPPCLERTDTRLHRLGNGIRETTDTDATGIFKKFGSPRMKILNYFKEQLIQTNGKK